MSYAGTRRVIDADSHLMELPGFLADHADPAVRDRLPPIRGGLSGLDIDVAGHDQRHVASLVALGDDLLRRGPKWHAALGAFDGADRARALDLLGFERQLVFSSLCAPLFDVADPAVRYGAYRAHNRAMAAFCAHDRRLVGVGLMDLDEPAHSVAELDALLDLGLGAAWLPARAPGGRSPGHPAHAAVWASLAEAGVPFVLHVGSGAIPIGEEWMDDGHPERTSARGGAEVIGSKDLSVIHHPIERFLSVLLLDGVLEAHPGLRGGAIEVGAGWVTPMLRRLDHAADIWARSEPHLAAMAEPPSEQARARLRFTPYPFEDVGRMVAESWPELYMFSSDYPHAEGGRDPLGRFERSLAGAGAEVQDRFFAANAAAWLAGAAEPAAGSADRAVPPGGDPRGRTMGDAP